VTFRNERGGRYEAKPGEFVEAYNVYVIGGFLFTSRTDDKSPELVFGLLDKDEALARLRAGGSAVLSKELRDELDGMELQKKEE
jgi:hypothetical protein